MVSPPGKHIHPACLLRHPNHPLNFSSPTGLLWGGQRWMALSGVCRRAKLWKQIEFHLSLPFLWSFSFSMSSSFPTKLLKCSYPTALMTDYQWSFEALSKAFPFTGDQAAAAVTTKQTQTPTTFNWKGDKTVWQPHEDTCQDEASQSGARRPWSSSPTGYVNRGDACTCSNF